MNRRGSLWRGALVAGIALVGVYFLLPGTGAKDALYSVIGVASTAVILFGTRLHAREDRLAWYLIGAGNGCFVVADALSWAYTLLHHGRAVPFPSGVDAVYLLGYPLLFVGLSRLGGRRKRAITAENWVDAAIVAIGVLALSWQVLMGGDLHGDALSGFGRAVALAYPIMDIAVLFIVVSSLAFSTRRCAADRLIALAVLLMLIADFGYDVLAQLGTYQVGNPIDAGWLLNYVLLAVAALHPSVRRAPSDTPDGPGRRRQWMPIVAMAGVTPALILLIGSVLHVGVDVPVLAAISLLLFVLAVGRVSLLFGRIEAQHAALTTQAETLRLTLAVQENLENDLRHQAFHDRLTGLANRALLQDRTEHALAMARRGGHLVAVIFCDLDGFKTVNESLGHISGDELLIIAAKRLASVVRTGDTIARLGGDEFALLIDDVTDPAVVLTVAERVVSVLSEPTVVAGQRLSISVSVGVTMADGSKGVEELLSEADAAMYEAKARGKDRYEVFQSAMRSRVQERLELTTAFPIALEQNHFFLEYQPYFGLADGQLRGFEALVRWQHPQLGRIAPYRFVPIAEETGFIVPLGRWVLEAACVQAVRWARTSGRPLTVSVNLSARQLRDGRLVDDVRSTLAMTGLPPRQLVLEITESMLVTGPEETARVLDELRSLGVRLAIDDFGTGYSSLSQLRRFPVDILKIDKSFVDPLEKSDSEGAAFVRTIIRLASDLKLTTIAEGIEFEQQRATLYSLGCDGAQGYLMSRPLSEGAAAEFARSAPLRSVVGTIPLVRG